MADGFEWVCSGVYGPMDVNLRDALWAELDTVMLRWSSAWGLLGELNAIKYLVERFSCTSFSPNMFKFSNFIEKHFLVDLPLMGGDFTWFRGSNNPSKSRIEKVLISTEWEDHFLDVTQRLLPCMLSNHCPLLVEAGGVLRGKSPFKFENMWLKVEGFVDRVSQWWNSCHFVGPPSFVLACKLKVLKGDLKHWNKHVFGDVSFRKKLLID